MTMRTKIYDVVIIGGGIMGCCTAYHLMIGDDKLNVAVIERDPTYQKASTCLSWGNIRIQFELKENIQISQYAFETLERFEKDMAVEGAKPAVGYHPEGNLFLVSEEGRSAAEEALALQKNLGCMVEWWTPEKIRQHYSLYEINGLAGGTFSPQDGYIDPYRWLMSYKTKARFLGAEFFYDEVVEIKATYGKITGVRLSSGQNIAAKFVVNCTGAWAAQIAQTAGVQLPVLPVMRQSFIMDPAVKLRESLPLTILPSGLGFRHEIGDLIFVGKSFEEDSVGFDFTWNRKRFMDILWSELAEFIPIFDTLKLIRGWAGLHAVNPIDKNSIIGEWPEIKGFFLANGFSGHGLQQGPAVGRYLSELILGRPPTLDLSVFGPKRILENKPLKKNRVIV
jgi:glycine/D-amino acid oxidase-like deaminating enzyme